MAKNDQGTDEVSRESIFRGLMKEQNDIELTMTRDESITEKVLDASYIAEKMSKDN